MPTIEPDTRLYKALSLGKMLAEVHLQDGDCLGEAARLLWAIIDSHYPEIDASREREKFDC